MGIKATLKEWKEAPNYPDIRELILKDKSDEELIHIRNLCLENKKRLRYLGLYMWGFFTLLCLAVFVPLTIVDQDPTYMVMLTLFVSGMFCLFVVNPSGPSTNTRKAIEEILIDRYEN